MPPYRMANPIDAKPRDTRYILRRLGHYIYQYRFLFMLTLALTLFENVLALIGPKLSGQAIDAIAPYYDNAEFFRHIAEQLAIRTS